MTTISKSTKSDPQHQDYAILETFKYSDIKERNNDRELAKAIISAIRRDGIFQVELDDEQYKVITEAFKESQWFFAQDLAFKSKHFNDSTYSCYIASGEEVTDGLSDYSEIFTICKDVDEKDPRVLNGVPCHGPVPWPSKTYKQAFEKVFAFFGGIGEDLLHVLALELCPEDRNALNRLTKDGWHHMRVLHFPPENDQNGARGIGSHTDYGGLVIAAQTMVDALCIRPPVEGELRPRNWIEGQSTAGLYTDKEPWNLIKAVPNILTVFPGDMMQYLTDDFLLSTPHKVKLAKQHRYALAYFHEPSFDCVVKPLKAPESTEKGIHYGTHFTNMYMRCYPDKPTTKRIEKNKLTNNLFYNRTCNPGSGK